MSDREAELAAANAVLAAEVVALRRERDRALGRLDALEHAVSRLAWEPLTREKFS